MIARTQKRLAAFRSARVHEFGRSNQTPPTLREHLGNFFLSRQRIWNREIVLAENSPNLASCEQVARVIDRAQYLP
jgi:hypothetical protein